MGLLRSLLLTTAVLSCGAAAAGREPALTMREIVENVRANELLYADLEVRIRMEFRLLEDLGMRLIKENQASSRFVYQGGWIYFKNDEKPVVTDGKVINWSTLQGFDGTTTRIVEQESLANIRRGRVEDPRLFRPHTMLIGPSHGPAVAFPLSTDLQGGHATRRQARFADAELAVFSEGEELLDGLDCVKVRIEYWSDAWKERDPELRWLWLAVDRNYLPVRTTALFRGFPRDHLPPEVGRAWDFRELAPGIWLPFRASSTVYKGTRVGQVDPNVVSRKWELTIDEARLDPKYDVSLFRDIPIPDGMPVFEVAADGAILRKYVQGVADAKPGSWRSRTWILALVFLLLAVGAWVFARRTARRLGQGMDSAAEHLS